MDKEAICKIEVDTILRYGNEVSFDVYIRLSDTKIVKISRKEDKFQDVVLKYKVKGVTHVYVNKADYVSYLQNLKNSLTNKFFDPGTQPEKAVVQLNDAYSAVRESCQKMGFEEHSIALAEEVSKKSMEMVNKSPNIFKFFIEFKEKCDKEFMRKMLVSYTSSLMITTFEWQSAAIKEKAALASMLCDITLTPQDFVDIKANEKTPEKLSERLRNHPLQISSMLLLQEKQGMISKETLLVIEQHHERPEGEGLPRKLRHTAITLLSAIHIVADLFIDLLIKHNFDSKQQEDILTQVYNCYNQGNFRKATISLCRVFGIELRY